MLRVRGGNGVREPSRTDSSSSGLLGEGVNGTMEQELMVGSNFRGQKWEEVLLLEGQEGQVLQAESSGSQPDSCWQKLAPGTLEA